MFNLFNKNKDIILDLLFAQRIIKDKFILCANIRLEDIRKKDRKLYKLLHKFEAEAIINKKDNEIYVDYNDFVECVLFYNRSKRYNTFIRIAEERISLIDKITKNLIQDICEDIHDGNIKELRESVKKAYTDKIYTQEQYEFLIDYIDYIVSMSRVQELSVVEMCQVAYEYIVRNNKDDMFYSFE